MKLTDMNSLFVHELKDLLHAEKQLVKALPKMSKAAHEQKLRQTFDRHLEETWGHVERLESILQEMGESTRPHRCPAMEGLIQESSEILQQNGDVEPSVLDAAIISAAQRVEHYEIAGYGCARAFAQLLGNTHAADLLQKTLDEEGAADKRLTEIAESQVNPRAKQQTVSG